MDMPLKDTKCSYQDFLEVESLAVFVKFAQSHGKHTVANIFSSRKAYIVIDESQLQLKGAQRFALLLW